MPDVLLVAQLEWCLTKSPLLQLRDTSLEVFIRAVINPFPVLRYILFGQILDKQYVLHLSVVLFIIVT